MSEFDDISDQYHRALQVFIQGDPEPALALWSTHDDTTLANPFSPIVRGVEAVRETATRATKLLAGGEGFTVEQVSRFGTADLAYEVEIHRFGVKVGGADTARQMALRVTTIYRREETGWRVAHRHADPNPSEVAG
jgi:ketosteroid isomerase-like protein